MPSLRKMDGSQRFLNSLTLSSPASRVGWWLAITSCVYIAPFYLLTNLSLYKFIGLENAPSIGLTRAYWFMLHGQFAESIAMNALILPVLIVGLPLVLRDVYSLVFTNADATSTASMEKD